MKKFDFIIQMILFVFAICLIFGAIFNPVTLVLLGYLQFFVGCWQVLSAFITFADYSNLSQRNQTHFKRYWLMVILYFMVLIGITYLNKPYADLFFIWFYCAWIIAAYYFIITKNILQQKTNHKTFLEIIN